MRFIFLLVNSKTYISACYCWNFMKIGLTYSIHVSIPCLYDIFKGLYLDNVLLEFYEKWHHLQQTIMKTLTGWWILIGLYLGIFWMNIYESRPYLQHTSERPLLGWQIHISEDFHCLPAIIHSRVRSKKHCQHRISKFSGNYFLYIFSWNISFLLF